MSKIPHETRTANGMTSVTMKFRHGRDSCGEISLRVTESELISKFITTTLSAIAKLEQTSPGKFNEIVALKCKEAVEKGVPFGFNTHTELMKLAKRSPGFDGLMHGTESIVDNSQWTGDTEAGISANLTNTAVVILDVRMRNTETEDEKQVTVPLPDFSFLVRKPSLKLHKMLVGILFTLHIMELMISRSLQCTSLLPYRKDEN